ncbi:Inner membrane amino-acid ABC transporter permease protein YecS [Marinomonas spartinae]|uniref:Inner membrane amino-acid ABC transporter permease protein YecS n=1 Tax=Marinomonas spartinae TaxID=1792290 RepID=A0A1A8TLR8_9GAMM|nr:ectoine/hydroxyectoine ABC transporter permease subunit EhuC [Marinomonas spartinae]SBS34602.1 Inner membrane amino-acid ABC transporter permease protein YecS [Marinomonas spartinae]SBS38193.1 Inner membrane amino-acid ABC transporter permease protein YecS [Marinomonas spartinae]
MEFGEIVSVLLQGAVVTIKIVAMALPLAAVMAFIFGLIRLYSPAPFKQIAIFYIEFFRGTSALIQLYWIYFVLPFFGITIDAMTAAVVALGLNIGAYGTEVVRGAVQSVPKGQYEASIALNFTARQRVWRIILPQALVNMIPPFGNLAIELVKATSLVSLITIGDLTFKAKSLADTTLQVGEIFGVVLLLYFIMSQALALLFKLLEKRLSKGLGRGGIN